MSNILILSHTQSHSDFKIGSHHYANGLSELGHQVYYSGMPRTIFHKLLRKEKTGPYKLNNNVINLQIGALLPLTMPLNIITRYLNSILFSLFKKNREIKKIKYHTVICDSPFFFPLLRNISYDLLCYRPTDNYVAMVGEKAAEYERNLCDMSEIIVCTSKTVAENIVVKYSIDEMKVKVIANGYDSDHFFSIANNKEKRKNALYIGALDYRFDFDALYKLAVENKDVIFDIYGPAEKRYDSEILKIKKLGNVYFHGKVDYLKTNEIMNEYKIGLLLLKATDSNLGRSPMKLWEYLASGLNVIYANIDNVETNECLYKYESYEEMLDKYQIANSQEFEIPNDFLEKNSWKKKVLELNTLIV
ncbi:glycosyltransferase [Serratia fonticola]|uniref:glycosyltransferase n=1 Tax=Serratia fonticola TaxID=47917 RepID=UPI00217B84D5|nr:glycosyltransferase [Serratia fonticola]CAI1665244.1 Glycosyl transferases group 1 [Serratia fonticola]